MTILSGIISFLSFQLEYFLGWYSGSRYEDFTYISTTDNKEFFLDFIKLEFYYLFIAIISYLFFIFLKSKTQKKNLKLNLIVLCNYVFFILPLIFNGISFSSYIYLIVLGLILILLYVFWKLIIAKTHY